MVTRGTWHLRVYGARCVRAAWPTPYMASNPLTLCCCVAADTAASLDKKIKNLQKKIRQTEELRSRAVSGDVVPSAEQEEKMARLPKLHAELKELEAQAVP